MKRIIPLALCFLLVFSFTFTQPVFAEITTITWTGEAGDGLWHTDGNWDLGQKPNDSDLVIIPESADVVYGGGVTSVRLNCAGNLTVSDGALKIIGDSMLTSGKLDGAGDIEILATGKLTWNGGSIEGSGKLILNQSELLVSQPCLERYLVTIGSLSKLSIMSDSLKLTGGAEGEGDFPIQAGQTLELADSESYNLSSLNINNYGTLKVANTCEFVRFNYDFTQQNTGTLEFDIGGPDDFTKLEVGDEAMLYGKLKINMLDGYVPHEGDTFEIITYNKKYGTFSSIVSNIDDITFEPAYNGTSLTLTVAAKAENVCKIGATEYATLDDALAAVQSGETIELLRDIDYVKDVEYDGAIFIDGTDITIDLNGYTLNVNNSRGPGIKVRNGGKVKCINGKTTGSFNVTGYEYGVWAEDAGTVVRVNNITSRGSTAYNYGVLAKDSAEVIVENDIVVSGYSSRGVAANGGVVTVKGDVYLTEGSGESVGLNVFNEGRIVVEGSVNVSGYAVKGIIAESNASIDISGDVTAMGDGSIGISSKEAHVYVDGDVVGKRMGISARKASVIHVAGNVTSTAGNPTTDGSSRGIEINDECQIIVEGNVQSNDIGVNIIVNDPAQHTPSEIYIDGKITAPKYISIWGTSLGYEDYNGITPSGYRIYEVITGDSSGSYTLGTVFVKVEGVIPVAPTAPQDFIATPGDGQVMLSWIPPGNNGGSAIRKYEVSKDDGENWINVGLNTSYTFTGLTNGTEYTFKVWAVNGVGPGAEATVTATPVVPEFAGGSGSEEDPYLIETVNQLDNVRNYLGTEHSDKHFKLNANLNLDVAPYNSDTGWQPIGTSASPFTGTFDGGGHTISGLFANRSVSNYVGLFGYTGAGAEIRDLVLEDVDVTGCYYVGGLVGNNSGEIINVHVSGNVTGEWDTGGLAGCNNNNGTITNSVFTGNVTGNDIVEYGDWTGGLVGYNLGTITRCRADATVVSEGKYVGGLVGENLEAGIITESCATGSVRAYSYTGGLVGSNDGEITACYSTCTVDGSNDVGGLVGGNSGPITDSFAVGLVDGTDRVGGLVGRSTGATVTGCYWDIETSGQSTSACGTSKSTANMKEQATFIGWDFDDVWDINGSDNNGYPFLRWQSFEAVPAVPTEPQNFIAEPGDGQVALSWAAPASDGGSAIIKYQVSKDNGESWTDVEINTYYTFTGLTNGTTFTFKVRAVNGVGSGAEASTTATSVASTTPFPAQPGMLYTWGRNEAGQMGDGTLIAKSIPTPIGTDEDWVAISTGANHTAALKSDGSLLTWGDNHYGKLGDGTEELRQYSPVRIGSDNDWVAVDTGENHTVALKSDGSLWAWGYATGGFGYGGFSIDWNVPTRVAGDSKWIAVSAGSQHTVAIKEDGTLWGWGFNTYGELGSSGFDDYIDYTENPVQISSDRWIEVSAGEYFTVGLKEDGSLWAWGRNNLGQLGDGSVVDKSIPIRIGSDTWLAAVAGADHVIAIKADGSLWAWGGNQYGELGNGSSDGITDPPPPS